MQRGHPSSERKQSATREKAKGQTPVEEMTDASAMLRHSCVKIDGKAGMDDEALTSATTGSCISH